MNKNIQDFEEDQYSNQDLNFIEQGKPEQAEDIEKDKQRQHQIAQDHNEQNKRSLLQQISNQYRVIDDRYYFKDQPDQIAFKDKGERIVSNSNDERVTKSMITMAQAKGWETIKVSGHIDFQRRVWMEASKQGLEVQGYKPTQQEIDQLDKIRHLGQQNMIERVSQSIQSQDQTVDKEIKPHQNPNFKNNDEINSRTPDPSPQKDPHESKASTPQSKEQSTERIHSGRILDYGADHYNHDKKNKDSYYVKLATDKGNETIWGVDLERAVDDENVHKGDLVTLKFKGSRNVEVEVEVKNKENKILYVEKKMVQRNEWEVLKSDEAKTVKAVGETFIDAHIKNPQHQEVLKKALEEHLSKLEKTGEVPTVSTYDKNAPSKESTQEQHKPEIERNIERTR